MMTKIFSVYDSKAKCYATPFHMKTVAQALRSWQTIVNDPKTQFCEYPEDFTLYEIGEFSELTGTFENLKKPNNLGLASNFKKDVQATTIQ